MRTFHKLTAMQAQQIRNEWRDEPDVRLTTIAARHGTTHSTISRIVSGQSHAEPRWSPEQTAQVADAVQRARPSFTEWASASIHICHGHGRFLCSVGYGHMHGGGDSDGVLDEHKKALAGLARGT